MDNQVASVQLLFILKYNNNNNNNRIYSYIYIIKIIRFHRKTHVSRPEGGRF